MRQRLDRNRPASNRTATPVGVAAALLAVWCQVLLVAAIGLAPLAQAADPVDGIPICHADAKDSGPPAPRQSDHSGHGCVLCVQCLSNQSPVALVSSAAGLPNRQFTARVVLDAYRPRAPPVRPITAAQPRGPPPLT